MNSVRVATPDGLSISAHACGNPDGPEILFIHGYSQCHLSWMRQLADDPLAREFRMAAYDLRGHGASDKPVGREWYYEAKPWADELLAVIEASGLRRPVLVAWSMAGRVVADYLRVHGQDRLAGIVFIGAVTKSKSAFWGDAMKLTQPMMSEDLSTNIAASRAFVRACFEHEPGAEQFETMLAYTMMMPPAVRVSVLERPRNEGDMLPKITVPTLVVHGERDKIVLPAAGEYTAASVPGARLSIYKGLGHSPFMEDAPRFNRELAEFVRGVG